MFLGKLLLPLTLLAVGQADQFKETKLEDGKIKVLLPGPPELMTQKLPNGVPLKMYHVRGASAQYIVAVMDLPETASENEEKLQERLDTARDLTVHNTKGKLLKETRIKLANKHFGREIAIELPDNQGVARQRFYFADGRMYQIVIIGPPNVVNAAAASKFLDSLVVTK